MEWTQVRGRLLAVVERLKQHRAVDIGIRELPGPLPVVGGFVGAYWDEIEVPSEQDALEIAAFLEHLADNRALGRLGPHCRLPSGLVFGLAMLDDRERAERLVFSRMS